MLLRGKGKKYKRESGILLPLSSLASRYGIGSLGEEAYRFADFLKKSGQTYWQMLPLCPVGKGNSPYSSLSTFAGEILYIDLDILVSQGLLKDSDIPKKEFSQKTNYKTVRKFKLPLLKQAADNFNIKNKDYIRFKQENSYWLKDFCLFMAIRDSNAGLPFYKWEDSLKYRFPNKLEDFISSHTEEILFYEITQYFFYAQFFSLKNYCQSIGIKLIGDIPFYVSLNSADVWSNPECFKLGRDMTPVLVAGVPPDIFSQSGQLWGNPVYDWSFQKNNGFSWWYKRLEHYSYMYDVIRIDHFRAFADYYTIPFGSPNAKFGTWEKGVGMLFWNEMNPILKHTEIIAEDLGGETPEVEALVKQSGFPNMKVLQFAFSTDLKNPFLPKNYQKNCVCYTGTHDNDTTLGWYENLSKKEKLLFEKLVPLDKSGSPILSLIAYGMKSKARIVIIPLQDYLELSTNSRTNTPGTSKDNWEWRYENTALTDSLSDTILRLSDNRN